MKNRPKINYVNIIIVFLAFLNAAIHLIFSNNLEFHRDELLYFSLGQHPALGYATVPPMIGWVAWLMQNTFGYSLFAIRFFPAVLGGLMVFLISAIAKELGGSGYSRILAAVGIIVSVFGLRTFLLFQPVHIDLMLWTLLFYLIIKYINTT
jgi:4-amino-4-deoxy-L-arabinose transferase-like glycosyltransferase